MEPSPRSRVKQLPKRGHYDRQTILQIIDEALVAHVGFLDHGQPFVMPMGYGRRGDELLLHGASNSRIMQLLGSGVPTCVTITLLDGLVLAKSALHHSMNYRSVVILGKPQPITDAEDKRDALRVIVEHIVPGRWESCRQPTPQEEQATGVVSLSIDEASAKIRTGPPSDAKADESLPHWAGVLPMHVDFESPIPADYQPADLPIPDHVSQYRRPRG